MSHKVISWMRPPRRAWGVPAFTKAGKRPGGPVGAQLCIDFGGRDGHSVALKAGGVR